FRFPFADRGVRRRCLLLLPYRPVVPFFTHHPASLSLYLGLNLCVEWSLLIGRHPMTEMPNMKQLKYQPVSHVIFDMDGLLFDTERLYTIATERLASRYGCTYSWEVKVEAMGKQQTEAAKVIVEKCGLPLSVDEYCLEINEMYKEVFPKTALLPGVERLVNHLKENGVPIAIATSSSKASYDLKTVNHQEFVRNFDHIVLGSSDPDVKHGKPSPDIFLVAAERFPDKPDPTKVRPW
ncbi:unnamed protein product, partial [Cyprideis torosa]